MKEIALTRGFVALVDDEDFDWLSQYKWYVRSLDDCYAMRRTSHPTIPGNKTNISMHRMLMGLALGNPLQVDHIDGNKLNNQKHNLRIATHAENNRNHSTQRVSKSGIKGVRRKFNKWQANITYNNKTIHLGNFNTSAEAHAAYCEAAKKLHGEFANFGKFP